MPLHIKVCLIALCVCAVFFLVYGFAKFWVHVRTERDLEEFRKEFGRLAAKEKDKGEEDKE